MWERCVRNKKWYPSIVLKDHQNLVRTNVVILLDNNSHINKIHEISSALIMDHLHIDIEL